MKRIWTIVGVANVAASFKWYQALFPFFRVDDHDQVLARARVLVVRFEDEPHMNEHTHTRECSLRDPDGYHVTVSTDR